MQLLFGVFSLATYSLTGNKKPGGSILHPHHQFLKEIGNLLKGHILTPPVLLESLRD
jgi:hypothetical protein